MAGRLVPVLSLRLLRLALPEIIEDGGVIQNASVSILDPVLGVDIFCRLLDTRHFPNDRNQRTGIDVLKEVLPIIVGKRRARADLLISTVPNRDRADSNRAP